MPRQSGEPTKPEINCSSSAKAMPPSSGASTAGITAGSSTSTSTCSQYPMHSDRCSRAHWTVRAAPSPRSCGTGRKATPAACRSSRYSSWARMPSSTTCSSRTYGRSPSRSVRSGWPRPVTRARSSPAAAPTYEALPGCRKSEWPSMYTSPYGSSSRARIRAMVSAEPSRIEQSPPSTSGNSPASTSAPIRSASRREYQAISCAWHTPSPGRQSPGSYRGGVTQPASRAPSRLSSPWSRRAPGALPQPGTEVPVGGRNPRLPGASRTAIRRIGGLEECARELSPGGGHGRIVRAGDGEQREQVLAYPFPFRTGGSAYQLNQATVGLLRLPGEHLDVGRAGLRGHVVRGRLRRGDQLRRVGPLHPPDQRHLGEPGLGGRVGGRLREDLLVRLLGRVQVARHQRVVGRLQPRIGRRLDLDAAALAHRLEPRPPLRLGEHPGERVDRLP